MLYAAPSINNGFNIDGPLAAGTSDGLPWIVNQDGSSSITAMDVSKLTGTTLPSSVVNTSITSTGTLGSLSVTGTITNALLTASQIVGTDSSKHLVSVATTGSGSVALSTSPTFTTPILGTPTSGVLTNCTGTASGLTAGTVSTISGLIAQGANITITGSGTAGSPYSIAGSAPVSSLAFSAITAGTNAAALVVGTGGSLGVSGSGTIAATSAPANGLTGSTLNSGVTASSLTSVGTLTSLSVTGAVTAGSHLTGTLGYTAANLLASFQSSVNSYNQVIIQNSSSGTTASSDFVVNNNNSTDTTFYGDFGMNSSGFTGSGSFNLANAVYLSATSGDLVVGTTTANNFRVVVNGLTTDALKIDSSQIATFGGNVTLTTGIMDARAASGFIYVGNSDVIIGLDTGSSLRGIGLANTASIRWVNGGASGTAAAAITHPSSSSWTVQLGLADASTASAQTLSVQSVAAGNSNVAGANFTQAMSRGTGTGIGGSWILQVAPAGTTGTAQNALVNALVVDSTKLATFAGNISAQSASLVALSVTSGTSTFNQVQIAAGNGYFWSGRSSLFSPSDGIINFRNNANNADSAITASSGTFSTTLSVTGHPTFEGVTSTGATGTGNLVYSASPTFTTPLLGTPTSGVLTNCTGTAAGLTAGNVTTNANLTGDVTSVGNAATIALSVVHAWTGAQYFAQASLTDAATITWNANTQQAAYVLLTSAVGGTRVLGAPSNLHAGATYTLIVQQSSTGTNALTYNAVFKWPGGTVPTLSTGNNAIDILTFITDGTSMFGAGFQKGFA